MTRTQRLAFAWLTGVALVAVVMTLAGEAAIGAVAVPAPAPQQTSTPGL